MKNEKGVFMTKIIFSYPDNFEFTEKLAKKLGCKLGDVVFKHFPDAESYVRISSEVKDQDVVLVCSLTNPDSKILPIIFFAETAKKLGAKSVGLVAPYLAYMRQDKSFQPGEAVNSKIFANLLSSYVDWVVTVDPHLHRHKALEEIYTIPAVSLHASKIISVWINKNVSKPLLIGPDEESKQWVASVAECINAPYVVLQKIRHNSTSVEVSLPNVEKYLNHTPVLVDDIISTAGTMIETIKHLQNAKMKPTVCVGVHAVFVADAYQKLLNAGVDRVVTCNTIKHKSNEIDVSGLVAEWMEKFNLK